MEESRVLLGLMKPMKAGLEARVQADGVWLAQVASGHPKRVLIQQDLPSKRW